MAQVSSRGSFYPGISRNYYQYVEIPGPIFSSFFMDFHWCFIIVLLVVESSSIFLIFLHMFFSKCFCSWSPTGLFSLAICLELKMHWSSLLSFPVLANTGIYKYMYSLEDGPPIWRKFLLYSMLEVLVGVPTCNKFARKSIEHPRIS